MRKIVLLPLLFSIFLSGALYGQDHYKRALSLYESGMWGAAKVEFLKARAAIREPMDPLGVRCDFLIAMCASQGDEANARNLLEDFLTHYPHTVYHNDVLFALSNELYKGGEWGEALVGYLSVDSDDLPDDRQGEYFFKLGHCYFQTGDYTAAYRDLQKVDRQGRYGSAATYYTAYIDYTRSNYAAAKQGFLRLADDPAYGAIAPFYLLQIEFLQNNYDYVVRHGDPLLKTASKPRATEIARIMGESWYHLGDHARALHYLELYRSLGGQMGREENYIEGYCRYATGDYSAAATALGLACGPEDALSQNAAYHLADCYLRMGEKRQAMQSFSIASAGRYDDAVREDALFNYGKLQYELGGGVFNEAINVLNRYIREYPSSPRIAQAREYLVSAYYNSRNYEAAYEAIQLIPDPDNNIKAALQKITYFRAMEYLNAGNLPEARRLLEIAAANRFTAKYTALTSFWRGEVAYRQGDYKAAAALYREYTALAPKSEPEYEQAFYALGYCSFNMKEWDESASWFGKYMALNPGRKEYLADVYNRLGDIKYSQHAFWAAITEHDKAIALATPQRDYGQWRRALLLGMVDRVPRKIESLQAIVSAGKGDYVDDATYELGRTYMGQERFPDAAAMLQRYLDAYPQGASRVDALADLGLAYQNMGKNDKALETYKQIVAATPNSPQAKDALLGIRSIYVDNNDVDGYLAYASRTGMETDLSAVQRDSLSFASAQRQYLTATDLHKGVAALQGYLKNFPKGIYRARALYDLGEGATRTGDRPTAKEAYKELSGMYQNEYTVRSLEYLSRMQEEDKELAGAFESYKKLSALATVPATVNRALEGMLRTAPQETDRVALADEVLASPFIDKEVTRKAQFLKAQALAAAGKTTQAMPIFEKLAVESQSAEGAESAYIVIEARAGMGNAADAKKRIFALADQNSPHTYWVGKAFLILGDMYEKEGDSFQARATFQSIVDGYPTPGDGIIDAARERIKNLK